MSSTAKSAATLLSSWLALNTDGSARVVSKNITSPFSKSPITKKCFGQGCPKKPCLLR